MATMTDWIDLVFSWILPSPVDRQAYTWKTAPLMFASVGLLLVACYIRLRCPSLPFIWRLGFGLIAIPISLTVGISRFNDWSLPDCFGQMAFTGVMIDFVLGVNSIFSTLLIAEYVFLGKEEDFNVKGVEEYRKWQKKKKKSNKNDPYPIERPKVFPGTGRWLEVDVGMSLRGLGFGRGLNQSEVSYEAGYKALIESEKINEEGAKKLKWQTIGKVTRIFFVCFLTMDLIETFYRNPKILSTKCKDGPCSLDEFIVNDSLGKYGKTIITTVLGVFLVADMQAYYCLLYLFALLFTTNVKDIPITISLYEPMLFYRPHVSTSLKDLWGRHWHALFKRPFLLFAYRPANKIASFVGLPKKFSRALGILATFTLSGILHEMTLEANLPHFKEWDVQYGIKGPIRTAYRGFGANGFISTRFFLAQGVGIIMEDIFTSIIEPKLASILYNTEIESTTKKPPRLIQAGILRNILGWIWCMSFVVYFGYGLIDIWLRHGIATLKFTFSLTQPITDAFIDRLLPFLA